MPVAPRRILPVVLCTILVAAASAVLAQQQPPSKQRSEQKKSEFLRLVRDGDEVPSALQAAIVRHVPRDRKKDAPTVDLVAAVHVAEGAYYRHLNREFRNYDVVLYELVAPKGTRVPKGGGSSDSPVSMFQGGLTKVLELEFQLEQIDYTRKNMVHADMSPEQFAESMQRRGETVFGMFLRMLGYAIARQNQGTGKSADAELLLALFDPNRALALKRVLAEQFEDMEGTLLALDGPEGSTMIAERNKVALKVLRKQLSAGKRKIAIFYGAGHMPDLQKRLRDQFGLVPVSTRWLVAWDLKSAPKPIPKAKATKPQDEDKATKPQDQGDSTGAADQADQRKDQ